jgi:formate hydrogenlyase subunit 6/NADH:ubiquinone oxidoreductase subunit I
MPRNYVANDSYPMLELDEIKRRITNSYNMIEPTAETIKKGGRLKSRHIWLFETIITVPFNPVWSKLKLRAKDFHTTEKCIGCGKCVKVCPLNNIALQNKKPLWGDHCTHCMACICNCPTEAIEYGTISQGKEKYNFGKYSYVVKETSTPKS